MASLGKNNFIAFEDVKIFHCDGYRPEMVLQKVQDFLTDPANAKFRLIDTHVDYVHPTGIHRHPDPNSPEDDMWVEVTIIYREYF